MNCGAHRRTWGRAIEGIKGILKRSALLQQLAGRRVAALFCTILQLIGDRGELCPGRLGIQTRPGTGQRNQVSVVQHGRGAALDGRHSRPGGLFIGQGAKRGGCFRVATVKARPPRCIDSLQRAPGGACVDLRVWCPAGLQGFEVEELLAETVDGGDLQIAELNQDVRELLVVRLQAGAGLQGISRATQKLASGLLGEGDRSNLGGGNPLEQHLHQPRNQHTRLPRSGPCGDRKR